MSRNRPHWLVPDSIDETVARALEADASFDRVARELETAVDDAPRERIRTVIETSAERLRDRDGAPSSIALSQSPTTDETPPESPLRYLDRDDVQYLSDREFARLLGLVLERFEGSSIRPGEGESVLPDLYWNRSHTTVAIRTLANPPETPVDEATVEAALEGETELEGHRSPSMVALVTNTAFTDAAAEAASDADLRLFDGGHLEAWFERVTLPKTAVSTVLESGEDYDGDLTELVELPAVPVRVRGTDPFEVAAKREITIESATNDERRRPGSRNSTGREEAEASIDDRERDPGQRGTLYADPDEDGDAGAIDGFLDGLDGATDD